MSHSQPAELPTPLPHADPTVLIWAIRVSWWFACWYPGWSGGVYETSIQIHGVLFWRVWCFTPFPFPPVT
ncbi:hypothetical protein OF83DRAFT_25929 [Amylostereum chailletii]|nr:hypothetical protein OF83DRAFT_25929 [Amylostereum chailletii]